MPGPTDALRKAEQWEMLAAAFMEPPRRKLAELLTAMRDVGIDNDFERQSGRDSATDVFD